MMNTLLNMIFLATKLRLIKTASQFIDPLLSFTADYTKELIALIVVVALVLPVVLYIIFRKEKVVVWTYVVLTLLIAAFMLLIVPRID